MRQNLIILLMLLPFAVKAQTVTNVVAEQVGKTIVVSYLLDKQADISIQYSTDGGHKYQTMSHFSGDAGRNIAAGQHTITWDVLADMEKMVCNNLVFKVTPSGGENLTFTVKGVEFTMVKVEGGTFMMGATPEQGRYAEDIEKPCHSVVLSTYYMGETEVTQALWKAVMGRSMTQISKAYGFATWGVGDSYPMYDISYEDCKTFISKLNRLLSSQLDGKQFALPTEAQWEYAARGGKRSKGYKYSGSDSISVVAWHDGNSENETHPVKMKQANELGIYDMSGNVQEWCQDWYDSYSSISQKNPQGPEGGRAHVCRGGNFLSRPEFCRVSSRDSSSRYFNDLGFRLCLQ